MKLEHKRELQAQQVTKKPGYFRTGLAVATDTIVGGVYSIEDPHRKEMADEGKHNYPRFSKAVELGSKYLYWFGMAKAGETLSRTIDNTTLGYTIVGSHSFLISLAVEKLRNPDRKLKDNLKPNLPGYAATFTLVELISIPIYIKTMEMVLSTTTNRV
ncbi:hypothetical protein HZC07_05685, partial [Candidatus Micrarchaeota archaeon]|nr:hypothetical protein [Candidatus Micrarchaeota archaeon]